VAQGAEFSQAPRTGWAQLKVQTSIGAALPTGSTPLGLYAELVRARAPALRVSPRREYPTWTSTAAWHRATPSEPLAAFIRARLTVPLVLAEDHVPLLRGARPTCKRNARTTREDCGFRRHRSGILGLGQNGHMPSTSQDPPGHPHPGRRTVASTGRDRGQCGWGRPAPTHGLTLGVKNVLEAARRCC